MKKKLFGLLISIVLLMQITPTTALAAAETGATSVATQITYNYTKENCYEVDIPAELNLNITDTLYIRANSIVLNDGYGVRVSVDTSTFIDNKQHLQLSLTTNLAKYIPCEVFSRDYDTLEESLITVDNNIVVVFKDGDTNIGRYGELKIVPNVSNGHLPSGEYQGKLRFNIEIIETSD